MDRLTGQISRRTEELGRTAEAQLERLTAIMEQASELAATMGEAVAEQADTVRASSDQTAENLTIVGNTLQAQARAMIDTTAKVAKEIADVIAALKDESGALNTSAGVAEERVQSIGRVFRHQEQELAAASGHATRKVDSVRQSLQHHSGEMSNALDRAAGQASQIGDLFSEQAEALIQAADRADAQARIVRENTFDSRRNLFLRASRFVIEDLNSTAIDMNRLLDEQGSSKLWPRLTRGDKGIFVRGMFQDDARHAREVIKGKFEEDDNFRKYVQRYLDQFERLLNDANESDPENLLSFTFLSADIGKLYLLLAQSLGRLY